MNVFLNVVSGMLGNLLTDFSKNVLNWQASCGASDEAPLQATLPSGHGIDETVRDKRYQNLRSASLMMVFCFILMSAAAYLPVAFGNFPSVFIDLADTRMGFLTHFFGITIINLYYFVFFMVAIGYIPIFMAAQLFTKTVAWFVNYSFTGVSRSRFMMFFVGSLVPVIILFAALITYLNYPGMTFWDCFTYSFLISVILLGFMGFQVRP